MSPKPAYPHSNAECVKLLKELGFKKKFGTGRGKHPEKYIHPTIRNANPNDRPFVLISHDFFDEKGKRLVRKLELWGFPKEQIMAIINNML
jgi:hypothetical protein